MAKKKSSKGRQRATTSIQVAEQITRYQNLADKWIKKTQQAAKKAADYQQKLNYYRQRLYVTQQEEIARLQAEAIERLQQARNMTGREQRDLDI